MRRLNFAYDGYGTWGCDPYTIERYQGVYSCFKNSSWFGPDFTDLEGAIRFCESDYYGR